MPRLGETVAALGRRRRDWAAAPAGAGLPEVRSFGANPGELRMFVHLPTGLTPGAPLVVVLHGCTQRAGAYAVGAGWIALADRFGFAVLAPEQDRRNNPNVCFNWFEPQDVTRGSGEVESIRSMTEHLLQTHHLDRERVFVTGLSAGGAMTSALLATYPELFAGGAVIAGLPHGAASTVQEAFAAMGGMRGATGAELGDRVRHAAPTPARLPRVSVWHGAADRTVNSSNALAVAHQWAAVRGLPLQPASVESRSGWTRSVWRSPDGEAVIEANLVDGLGHGTPLATRGHDPIGVAGPYLLEAGVSSSLEIARFWGLAPAAPASEARPPPDQGRRSLGETVMASLSRATPPDVQRAIEGALRAAGLLK